MAKKTEKRGKKEEIRGAQVRVTLTSTAGDTRGGQGLLTGEMTAASSWPGFNHPQVSNTHTNKNTMSKHSHLNPHNTHTQVGAHSNGRELSLTVLTQEHISKQIIKCRPSVHDCTHAHTQCK